MDRNIPVTEPFLPSKEEYITLLEQIWERKWLTNNGPLVLKLEEQLKAYLDLQNLLFLGNGTIALQIAIKALKLKGEIITTPFSYVATTSSIVWENCTPKFVDIDPKTYNIDPDLLEEAINNRTSAILATHVFGNPCEIAKIAKIAKKYNLKIIYDAAHCFGVKYKGKSIFGYGDVSTVSFHATKLFHTIEGGAVFSKSQDVFDRMKYMRNFGHDGPGKFATVGINGKNSEFHAAMGLCNIKYVDEILTKRKFQYNRYYENLKHSRLSFQEINEKSEYNYSYFPVVFENEKILMSILKLLENEKIYPRRYFYPSLSSLNYIENTSVKLPVTEKISKSILCLPLYQTLSIENIDTISRLIIQGLK